MLSTRLNTRGDNIAFEKLYPDAVIPTRATAHSAGYDLSAYLNGRQITFYDGTGPRAYSAGTPGNVQLDPGERVMIPLGFKARMAPAMEAQIRPRSGLSLKTGMTIANAPGTVDADYPGEWAVIVANPTEDIIWIRHGDRIAQAVFAHYVELQPFEDKVEVTTDRVAGHGSTGR